MKLLQFISMLPIRQTPYCPSFSGASYLLSKSFTDDNKLNQNKLILYECLSCLFTTALRALHCVLVALPAANVFKRFISNIDSAHLRKFCSILNSQADYELVWFDRVDSHYMVKLHAMFLESPQLPSHFFKIQSEGYLLH